MRALAESICRPDAGGLKGVRYADWVHNRDAFWVRRAVDARNNTQQRARRAAVGLWPQGWVTLRTPIALAPPPPRAFARFGSGSWIVPPARVNGAAAIEIGSDVVIHEHGEIWALRDTSAGSNDPLLIIGDGTRLARAVTIWATVGVHIGARVSSSDYVAIVDCWNAPGWASAGVLPPQPSPVVVRDGAYLGCGSVIGPGVTIGAGAYVGEGAVVTGDVPAHAVVYGNPAQITRHWSPDDGWRSGGPGRAAS